MPTTSSASSTQGQTVARLARAIDRCADDHLSHAGHRIVEAAEALDESYPEQAARLWRALGMGIVDTGKSKQYATAAAAEALIAQIAGGRPRPGYPRRRVRLLALQHRDPAARGPGQRVPQAARHRHRDLALSGLISPVTAHPLLTVQDKQLKVRIIPAHDTPASLVDLAPPGPADGSKSPSPWMSSASTCA